MRLRTPCTRAVMTLLPAAAMAGGALVALGATPAQATQYGSYEVHGAIEAKYLAKCGPAGVLGSPVTNETPTPDGVGRYNAFSLGGSIYWSPATGANEVHGAIRDTWGALAWEGGVLGYPITDETSTPGVLGRYNVFQRGSIYWSPTTGARAVYGAIRDAWGANGYEGGPLGFPISSEFSFQGARKSKFEGGFITWTPATGAVVHVTTALPPRQAPTSEPPCAVAPPPPPPPPPPPTPPPFANCDDMHLHGYPHGIGRTGASDITSGPPVTNFYVSDPGYENNSKSDRDHDNIACEA